MVRNRVFAKYFVVALESVKTRFLWSRRASFLKITNLWQIYLGYLAAI